MCRDQHRSAFGAQIGEDRDDHLLRRRVDAVQRLVEQQQAPLREQRPRQQDTLSLAAGELADLRVRTVGEADARELIERLAPQRAAERPVPRPAPVAADQHDVERRDGIVELLVVALRHVRDAIGGEHAACARLERPEHRAEQRRLAGPVRADDRDGLSRRHVEADAVERQTAPEADRQVRYREQLTHRGTGRPSSPATIAVTFHRSICT